MAGKLKYEDVKQDIEKGGWHLVSTDYVNLKTDLELKCPEGHLNYVSYEKWRRGTYECPICKQNRTQYMDNIAVKKNGYRILAFDQASITSGWSVFDDEKLIKFGHWSSDGRHSTERIAQTKQWMASMIKKWNPDKIIFEDIQLQTYKKNPSEVVEMVTTFKKLAHLQGVLKNYCYENGLIYKVVVPSTWRHHSEVKGNNRTDQKRSAQIIVKQLYDINVSQDEADAILIGRWAAHDNKVNEIIDF